jgi:hypothetical protein
MDVDDGGRLWVCVHSSNWSTLSKNAGSWRTELLAAWADQRIELHRPKAGPSPCTYSFSSVSPLFLGFQAIAKGPAGKKPVRLLSGGSAPETATRQPNTTMEWEMATHRRISLSLF